MATIPLHFFFRGGAREPRQDGMVWPAQKYPWAFLEIPQGGEWEVSLPRGTVRVGDGEALLLRPGVGHRVRARCRGHMKTTYALFSWRLWGGDDLVATGDFPQVLNRETGARIEPLLRDLIHTSRETDMAAAAKIHRLGFELLEVICPFAKNPFSPPTPNRTPGRDQRITRALDHIDQHWDKATNRSALAGLSGLSPSRFHTLFQQVTGFPPLEYIVAIRLQRAGELLEFSDLPVGEIAQKCGFSTLYYFSRCFRSHKKMTPTAYRALYQR